MPGANSYQQNNEKRTLKDLVPDLSQSLQEEVPDLIHSTEKKKKPPSSSMAKKVILLGLFALAAISLANYKFEPVIKGRATIIPQNTTVINTREEGVLKYLYKKHGQKVTKGELIGELINNKIETILSTSSKNLRSAQNNLMQLEETVVHLEKELSRKKVLYESGAISLRKLEEAQLEYKRLQLENRITLNQIAIIESEIDECEKRQKALKFYSPTDGIIITKAEELFGTFINQGDIICIIADMLPLRLEMPLEEKRMPLIRIGQKAELIYTVDPARTYTGKVIKVNPQLWSKQENPRVSHNVVSVIIGPDEVPPFPIRLSMTARAKIFTERKNLFDIIMDRMF